MEGQWDLYGLHGPYSPQVYKADLDDANKRIEELEIAIDLVVDEYKELFRIVGKTKTANSMDPFMGSVRNLIEVYARNERKAREGK